MTDFEKEATKSYINNPKLKEAVEWCKHMFDKKGKLPYDCPMNKDIDNVDTLVKLIEKQDKMIDLMLDEIVDRTDCPYAEYDVDFNCGEECGCKDDIVKNCWRKYFEKRSEE